MRGVGLLHLTRLGQQPVRALLTVVVVAAGVTLLVAVTMSQAGLARPLDTFNERTAGPATLEIRGASEPGGLDEATLGPVATTDGVAAAVPLVKAVTVAVDGAGDELLIVAMGVDCRAEVIFGPIGCADLGLHEAGMGAVGIDPDDGTASAAPTPVLSPRLHDALDGEGFIRSNRGRISIRNAPTVDRLDELNQGNVALFPLPASQELFSRHGAYDTILVVPTTGVETNEVRERLEAGTVGEHVGIHRTGESHRDDTPHELVLVLIGVLALGLGGALAHGALSLSLEERRRDLGIAGALGAPRRLLLTGTMVEAGILGLAGGAIGLAGGIAMTRPLSSSLAAYNAPITGVGHVEISLSAARVVMAIGLGLAVALVAAIRPAWRASRADLSSELRSLEIGEVEAPARLSLGVAFGLVGLAGLAAAWLGQRDGALETWQPPFALVGVTITLFFLLGMTVHTAAPLLSFVTARLRVLSSGLSRLAAENLAGQPRRTGIVTLVIAAAVAMGVMVGSVQRSVPDTVATEIGHLEGGTIRVTTLPTLNFGVMAARLEMESRARLAEIPGIDGVISHYGVVLEHPSLGPGTVGVATREPDILSRHPILRGDQVEETLQRGDVMIGPALARDLGLRPGDTFEVPGRHGMATLRVGAVWADGERAGRNLSLGYDQFEEIWGRHAALHLHVVPAAGTPVAALAYRIQSELRTLDPDVRALPPDAVAEDVVAEVGASLTPFWALQRGLIGVAALATTLTLLLVGVQRRGEYGMLAAIGLAPARLGRMLMVEAGLVGLLGTLVGTLVGLAGTFAFGLAAPVVTGWGIPFKLDLTAPLIYGLLTTACVVVGSALPAWRAARLDPSASLRFE